MGEGLHRLMEDTKDLSNPDTGTWDIHSKSEGAPKAEEMVAMGSGEAGTSSSVGRAGETQLWGGSPSAQPGEPYLSGHCRQRRCSPQH